MRYGNPEAALPPVAAPTPQPRPKKKQAFGGLGSGVDSSLKYLSSGLWGTAGYFGNSTLHSAINQSFLGQYGLIVTEAISVGIIALASSYFLDSKDAKRAILVGSLINVGIEFVKQYLPSAAAGLSGMRGPGENARDRMIDAEDVGVSFSQDNYNYDGQNAN